MGPLSLKQADIRSLTYAARTHGNSTTVLQEQVAAVVQRSAHLGSALDKALYLDPSFRRDLNDNPSPVGGQPSISSPPIRVAASTVGSLVLNRRGHVRQLLSHVVALL